MKLRFSDLSVCLESVFQLTAEGQWKKADIEIIEHQAGQQEWNIHTPIAPHDALYLLHSR